MLAPSTADHVDAWVEETWGYEDEVGGDSASSPSAQEPDAGMQSVAEAFELLADELAMDASGIPTVQAMAHPAYGEILALGEDVIPFLLERVTVPGNRPLWLRLLSSMTPYQPGMDGATIEESAAAWVRWSRGSGMAHGGPAVTPA